MASERDIKLGLQRGICSVTGKPCKCESGRGCSRIDREAQHQGDQALSVEARAWVKSAINQLTAAIAYLDEAKKETSRDRYHGKPEMRHAQAKIRTTIRLLEETL
jgi:hypothetical protein